MRRRVSGMQRQSPRPVWTEAVALPHGSSVILAGHLPPKEPVLPVIIILIAKFPSSYKAEVR